MSRITKQDWYKEFDNAFRWMAEQERREKMAKGTVEFRVVTADNGFIVEGGGKSMVAKTDQEIGEAVMAIFKAAAKPAGPKKTRTRSQICEAGRIESAKAAASQG